MGLSNDQFLSKLKNEIIKIQKEKSELFYGWKISLLNARSIQSLMLGDEKHGLLGYQEREVIDQSYEVEVYTRHGNPLSMGNSTCNIDPLMPLDKQILKTLDNATKVNNQVWDLPKRENETPKEVITSDPEIKNDIVASHRKLCEEVASKARKVEKVKINSAELYTNLRSSYFETSTGLQGEQDKTDIYFEIAMEKLPLPNTQEVHKIKTAISIEDARLSQFIDEAVEITLSIDESKLPRTQENAVIMIDAESTARLLHGLLGQINASSEYMKTPFLSEGQMVISGNKHPDSDVLNMEVDPSLPIMAASSKYTQEGLIARSGKVVEKDRVTSQIISNRMGQYLKKNHNSIAGNLVVPLGKKTKEELLKNEPECLEIISFLSLGINQSTLNWSSEIKLGKLYQYGKLKSIIKGGVISGNLKENLSHFKFSSKEKKFNKPSDDFSPPRGYVGPDAILIKNGVKIAGE